MKNLWQDTHGWDDARSWCKIRFLNVLFFDYVLTLGDVWMKGRSRSFQISIREWRQGQSAWKKNERLLLVRFELFTRSIVVSRESTPVEKLTHRIISMMSVTRRSSSKVRCRTCENVPLSSRCAANFHATLAWSLLALTPWKGAQGNEYDGISCNLKQMGLKKHPPKKIKEVSSHEMNDTRFEDATQKVPWTKYCCCARLLKRTIGPLHMKLRYENFFTRGTRYTRHLAAPIASKWMQEMPTYLERRKTTRQQFSIRNSRVTRNQHSSRDHIQSSYYFRDQRSCLTRAVGNIYLTQIKSWHFHKINEYRYIITDFLPLA